MTRGELLLRVLTRTTLWIYAHFSLEWLFHVTKPSVASAASGPDRVLLLVASPGVFLRVLVVAALLALLDSMRTQARARWIAAIAPASVATVLFLVAADNFVHTVFGYGIVSTEAQSRFFTLLLLLAAGAWILQSEANALARLSRTRRASALAAVLILLSAGAYGVAFLAGNRQSEAIAAASPTPQSANILLLSIDGLEANDVAPYNPERATPAIAALAARGVTFENAFSNAGRTYGSLISTLTGKLPTRTHILFPPVYLTGRDAVEHAPGLLRAHGYTTAQIGMRHYSDAEDWNMRAAFDVINGRKQRALTPDRSESLERLARYQTQLFARVVDRVLHLTFVRRMEDVHAFLVQKGTRSPYFADGHRVRLAEGFLQARREPWFLQIHLVDTHCCPDDRRDQIREADRNVGRLVELLRTTRQLDHTAIILFSDHTPRWGTLGRIPLVMAAPRLDGGRRIATNVQLVDLAPTILELAGIEKASWMTGSSLLRPEVIPADRPIVSLVEIGTNGLAGPEMKVVQDSTPPLYGAWSAGMVVCDQWVKLTFASKKVERGVITGHTSPCSAVNDARNVETFFFDHLRANGYPVGRQGL